MILTLTQLHFFPFMIAHIFNNALIHVCSLRLIDFSEELAEMIQREREYLHEFIGALK